MNVIQKNKNKWKRQTVEEFVHFKWIDRLFCVTIYLETIIISVCGKIKLKYFCFKIDRWAFPYNLLSSWIHAFLVIFTIIFNILYDDHTFLQNITIYFWTVYTFISDHLFRYNNIWNKQNKTKYSDYQTNLSISLWISFSYYSRWSCSTITT